MMAIPSPDLGQIGMLAIAALGAASSWGFQRATINAVRREVKNLEERIDSAEQDLKKFDDKFGDVYKAMHGQGNRINDEIGRLREKVARMEGRARGHNA